MLPHTITLVQEKMHVEMEAAKPLLQMQTSKVTPVFIETWDIHCIMEPVTHDITPMLTIIIESAGESKASQGKTKATKSKNRAMVGIDCIFMYIITIWPFQASLVIMAQIHYLHSIYSAKVPICLSLQAWASGTSQQMISVSHQSCLSVLYPSITAVVHSLAERTLD
jgi:hypothetical protein